ncbi:DUF305 domain-containing protein [Paragemmobacter aquarius]|uniref:DUF305 domain-containing protein n=1 Tax=Paragemmobacter aquarius TaxID=2169400 RepID=UPI001C1FF4AA|nr:DUF305 domain-containing protein [Gemmobacter aquarius]
MAGPAHAHVKWFAPYIVGASPQPLSATLGNLWFWTAIALVLMAFVATRILERQNIGQTMLGGMDRAAAPLWARADDFMRVAVGTFFVAIFAVGGVYLTPDLATPSEWVSWFQLLIAAGLFWRRTMPLSAAGIIILWAIALRDYDLFHLLDYLALGVGVAGYLVLAASTQDRWQKHRFEVLRWGVAIALMWSSLEKFAYPEWFYPLVLEKPFLTFGLPRDVFIPMAGVAEFTMGFGLLWTPLVRRLSSVALLIIFMTAVWPFGRVDMIGHALIMATIVLIALDPERQLHVLTGVRQSLGGVPLVLAAALIVFSTAYWGTHRMIYGKDGAPNADAGNMATHAPDPEKPHGPEAAGATPDPAGRTKDVPLP